MFTGIVEETGRVSRLERHSCGMEISIVCSIILADMKDGCSIAVNGVCLTVTTFDGTSFSADISPETVKVSNLGRLKTGDRVNLERAVGINGRLDGHLVSGHIDGTGRLNKKIVRTRYIEYEIMLPGDLAAYCIQKGSITIDGTSLTINAVRGCTISFLTIPHTTKMTILSEKHVGAIVNIEIDPIARYVEKLIKNNTPQHNL